MRGMFVFLGLLLHGVSALALDEATLPQSFSQLAIPYVNSVDAQVMTAFDGVKIRYRYFPGTKQALLGTIVVVNGRTEFTQEYAELLYDLRDSGYGIYIYDQRGQGESQRLLPDPLKGYVKAYQDYISDLQQFMETIVFREQSGDIFILSHSMGGGVATDYLLLNHPNRIKAMVASSPMFMPTLGVWPINVAVSVLAFEISVGKGADYAPGYSESDWQAPFTGNKVTNSENRYNAMLDLATTAQERGEVLVVSSPTVQWAHEAIIMGYEIQANGAHLTTPTLILQAGEEKIVDPTLDGWLQSVSSSVSVVQFPDAMHDILMEKDATRNAAIQETLKFFANSHSH
jgi:lysophospholipase